MDEMYQTAATALAKDPRILAAYVIGSTARGQAGAESDFDLVVVVRNTHSFSEDGVYELIRHISFPRDLDLSVVDACSSPLFLFQIVNHGTMIYEVSRKERVRFEAYALHTYYDSAHMRSIYASYLPERFSSNAYVH